MSPRMTPSDLSRGNILDALALFGGYYMELVGTPALSTNRDPYYSDEECDGNSNSYKENKSLANSYANCHLTKEHERYRRHKDIKPENILWFKDSDGALEHRLSVRHGVSSFAIDVETQYRTPPENRRKVLRVLIKNKPHLACPDSGSAKNIMSEALANECNLKIRRSPKNIKQFELGNGKCISSLGRVCVPVELMGNTLGRKKRWFYVFSVCPVPLVLGMPFLEETEILTKNRNMLESCPAKLRNISSLLWIGSSRNSNSPRNRMKCSLDGHVLDAIADTGSDLNLMSLKCAKREGFQIDRRREARRRIQVGDGTETETIGQVYVHNLSLDWRKASTPDIPVDTDNTPRDATPKTDEDPAAFGAIFHVLPGLPCDVIFGRDLLEQTNAFNLCPDLLSTRSADKDNPFELNVLINLGPVSIALRVLWRRRQSPTANPDPKDIHDNARHAEMFRRSKKEEEIGLLPVEQQHLARATERMKIRDWDTHHGRRCMYCNPV
ncbi:hypothetical protein BKA61DRAFT_655910 [Leptodontidium sp. MPI-SDFR-AT-0119]|nr:hypothetical protein BKA61DRAFT_655910 [Leptodontidium sp. MPI-SDFR-AT-0119]